MAIELMLIALLSAFAAFQILSAAGAKAGSIWSARARHVPGLPHQRASGSLM